MSALRSAFAFAALATLSSCATALREPASLPPAPPVTTTSAPAPAPTTTAPVGGASFAAPDTVPSPAALAVLATIPEPIGESASAGKGARKPSATKPDPAKPVEPVRAPERTSEGVGMPAPPELADSLQLAQAPPTDAPSGGSDTASVPVPAPTKPLGAGAVSPAPTPAPDPPASAPPVAGTLPAPAVEEPAIASADTCWRVQVGASSQRAKATRLRAAAESQLLMRMVVEKERNLWKVRTQDCVSRTTAESLKSRAMASGFQGVFLVRYVKRP